MEGHNPLATPMPAGDLLGPCGWPGARGHHVGDPGSIVTKLLV